MKRKVLWLFLSFLMALTLVAWSCGGTKTEDGVQEEEVIEKEPVIVATIDVVGDYFSNTPTAITVGQEGVWVAINLSRVVMIDPELNEAVKQSARIGAYDVAVGYGSVWCTCVDGNSVTRLDLAENTGEQIDVGHAPGGVAVGENSVWVANSDDGTISRIDIETNEVVENIYIGCSGLFDVLVTEGAVWVTAFAENCVYKIDAQTNQVEGEAIRVGASPCRLAYGGNSVWVANSDDGTISRIDIETNQVIQTIQVGNNPLGIAFGKSAVWVANRMDKTVSVIDSRTNALIYTIDIPGYPIDIAFGEGSIWVLWVWVDADENWLAKVSRIDS
jgi:YVTN family beta-propeller protein